MIFPLELFGIKKKEPEPSFRDLAPENRKKRKEPPKPWGRGERLFILIVFGGTVLTSAVLGLSSRDWKLPGLPRFALSVPNFLPSETIVIEEDGVKKADKSAKDKKTIAEFENLTNPLSGVYAFYVVRLDDGSRYGVHDNETFEAASLIKLPVFAALYKAAEKGEINLDAKYTLKNSDKIGGSGSLQGKPAGYVLTYRDMARLMGRESDNTAFGIVRKTLGDGKINDEIAEIGLTHTSLTDNATSPVDVGVFFEKLWKGQIMSTKSRDEILGYMTKTIYESWLPAGVPKEVRVAHKYGREVHVVNDGGIIFAEKPFVLVILTQGIVEKEADAIFPELARTVYVAETGN